MTRTRSYIDELYGRRPRSQFVRVSVMACLALTAVAWLSGGFHMSDIWSAHRLENLQRFLKAVHPYDLRDTGLTVSGIATWSAELMHDRGWHALGVTLGISIAAIVLAAIIAGILSLFAAGNVATAEPWGDVFRKTTPRRDPASSAGPALVLLWRSVLLTARAALIAARSVPEYIWAFLLIAAIGPSAWPAVLALAIHNTGILGKLWAENIENVDPAIPATLRAYGQSRLQVALFGVVPIALPRMLLYFFYRWETCIREATVLGMLGILSIGLWIKDARARDWYDEMLFFMLLGSLLVIAGDIVSSFARRQLHNEPDSGIRSCYLPDS